MQHEECKTCKYWDRCMYLCDYASIEGKTRIALNGGSWRKCYIGKCAKWKPGKKFQPQAGHAWREHAALPKARRKK